MRKLKFREIKWPVQGHTARCGKTRSSNSSACAVAASCRRVGTILGNKQKLLTDLKKSAGGGERGRQRGERHALIGCSIHLCICWLLLVCAPTRDQTHDPGIWGRCSNQPSCPARAETDIYLCWLNTPHLFLQFFRIGEKSELAVLKTNCEESAKVDLSF